MKVKYMNKIKNINHNSILENFKNIGKNNFKTKINTTILYRGSTEKIHY